MSAGPLEMLGPVGSLRVAGNGKALEGMRLKRPSDVAHSSHYRELPGLSLGGSAGGGTDGSSSDNWRHCGCCCERLYDLGVKVVCK